MRLGTAPYILPYHPYRSLEAPGFEEIVFLAGRLLSNCLL